MSSHFTFSFSGRYSMVQVGTQSVDLSLLQGRDGLVERIWQWKDKYGGRILEQLRRIGCSCDWERTRFTLDEVCAKAVYEAFFRFFKDGLGPAFSFFPLRAAVVEGESDIIQG